jgi:hypothetical protein
LKSNFNTSECNSQASQVFSNSLINVDLDKETVGRTFTFGSNLKRHEDYMVQKLEEATPC